MARLPVPGGDVDAWAAILNEYLLTTHNADGTQKNRQHRQRRITKPHHWHPTSAHH